MSTNVRELGPVERDIHDKLIDSLAPSFLEVVNESHKHRARAGQETHFKVVIVSDSFEGTRPLERHRRVHQVLATELAGSVHALSVHAYTTAQWVARGGEIPASPPCRGAGR